MKTSDKIWIFIGFFLLSMIVGYIIYDVSYLQKTTPKTYHVNSQINVKDDVLISYNGSYSAILGDDSYEEKKFYIKLLYSEVIREVLDGFYLENYLQKEDTILYGINQILTEKVLQKFPNIEFQIIDLEIYITKLEYHPDDYRKLMYGFTIV